MHTSNTEQKIDEILHKNIINFIDKSGAGIVLNSKDPKVIEYLKLANNEASEQIKKLLVEAKKCDGCGKYSSYCEECTRLWQT